MNSPALVQRLWNYCDVLRDDGMSYGDDVEQLTYLLVAGRVAAAVGQKTQHIRNRGFDLQYTSTRS